MRATRKATADPDGRPPGRPAEPRRRAPWTGARPDRGEAPAALRGGRGSWRGPPRTNLPSDGTGRTRPGDPGATLRPPPAVGQGAGRRRAPARGRADRCGGRGGASRAAGRSSASVRSGAARRRAAPGPAGDARHPTERTRMSGLQRAMRHPDRRSDPHARARALASDRLLAPLPGEDAAWLRDHLDACGPCRRMADSFAADRARILALREELPVPPRDLGARLSRALDVEVRRAVREDARRGRRSLFGSPSFALVGIAVAAVLAIVFLPLTLAGLGIGNAPIVPGPGGSGAPAATPMTVDTQAVAWVQRQPDGSYVLSTASVDLVCPGLDASSCGTLDGGARQLVALTMKPSAVVLQHNGTSAVLVGRNALYAFSVPPEARVTPTPVPSSSIATPGALSPTPSVTGVAATPPAATPVPTGSPSPRPTGTPSPASAVPAASASAGPTAPAPTAALLPTAAPSGEPAATPLASEVPTPAASLVSIPPASPAPSAAVTIPIVEGVVLVGAPPAYSTDGQWVAFSARPSDGTRGPATYVWHVGDATPRLLPTNHASVFSAWDVDQILGSTVRPAGSTGSGTSAVKITATASAEPSATASAEPSATPSPSASPVAATPAAPSPCLLYTS